MEDDSGNESDDYFDEWSIGTGSVTQTSDEDEGPVGWTLREMLPELNRNKSKNSMDSFDIMSDQRSSGQTIKLLQLPLDVVFEMFRLLHPCDLVALSRTCSSMRHSLVFGQLSAVWKASRAREDIPEPVHDRSETWWAQLLFACNDCQRCDSYTLKEPDWQLLLRVCAECKRKELITDVQFTHTFRGEDPSVLDMVLYTNVRGRKTRSKTRYYLTKDVRKMIAKVAEYEADVTEGKPEARRLYDEFIKARLAQVDAVMKHAPICADWVKRRLEARKKELQRLADCRRKDIGIRLSLLGYQEGDIHRALDSAAMTIQNTELNDESWGWIRPYWEKEVRMHRKGRMLLSHRDLIDQRRSAALQAYEDYRKTSTPRQWFSMEWLSLPPCNHLLALPPFCDLVYAEPGQEVGITDFVALLRHTPDLEVWKTDESTVQQEIITEGAQALKLKYKLPAVPDEESVLTWAVSTYTDHAFSLRPTDLCDDYIALPDILLNRILGLGKSLQDAPPHLDVFRNKKMLRVPRFCEHRSSAVAAILEILALPHTTKPAVLDARDARFICVACPAKKSSSGVWCRYARTWRSSAVHYAAKHVSGGAKRPPTWALLSEEEATKVRAKDHGQYASGATFSCAHCGHHLENWQSFAEVAQHVKETHDVANPGEADILHMPIKMLSEPPIVVPAEAPSAVHACYRCLLCPDQKNKKIKLFSENGVKSHLVSGKHKVSNPVENVHWSR